MSKRIELREKYMCGWYELNADLLLETTAIDFVFDDPAEPAPVGRDSIVDYMVRWDARTRSLGGNNEWILTLECRQDKDGILTDWEWWEVADSGLCGTAVVQTSDAGVMFERITYFDRDTRYLLPK